jgi:3-hydroxybutyryl-CoA dehydrogenase
VGVIGAGQMGSGIAHVCALAGYDVGLYDISKEAIEMLATINGNMARQVAIGQDHRRRTQGSRWNNFSSIDSSSNSAAMDLIIESATEDEEVKRKIFTELCPHLKESCLIASNTSSISITRLAAATDRPEAFMGMHFMNPVPVMKLVELIRGIATGDETFRRCANSPARSARTWPWPRTSRPSSSTASCCR